jgi:peptide/nickel transport system substrate-binding protein
MTTYRWIIFIVAAVALYGCLPGPESGLTSNSAKRIVYGLTLQPSGFDPHINRSSELGIPLRQVYDTLVYRDPVTREFVPGLAESWSVSEDGLIYSFKLRSDVVFHDDTPFNAQAVAANLDRVMAPETGSQWAIFLLGPYEGYEIVDNLTIRLRLSEPYSPFLDALAQVYLGIASPTALAEYSNNRYQFHQVGTGPFEFVEMIPGDRIVLKRNTRYAWGPPFYTTPDASSVDEIEFRFYVDPPTRVLALENGQAQVMGELLPTDARMLTGNSAIQLLPESIPGQPLQFLINTQRFPTDNRAFRQALLFSANRSAIIDAVYQQFSPIAWGPLAATTLYYDPSVQGSYAHDISQAQALLSSVGYSDSNNDGYLELAGVTAQIQVIVPPWGLLPQVSELLQDQWRTVGIQAVLNPVPTFGALLEAVNSGAYNLVAFNAFGLDPIILNDFYLSDGTNNWTGFASADLDALLLDASRQINPESRRALYSRVQRLIMEEALVLPIRDQVNLNAISTRLGNLTFDPYGWFPLLSNLVLISE